MSRIPVFLPKLTRSMSMSMSMSMALALALWLPVALSTSGCDLLVDGEGEPQPTAAIKPPAPLAPAEKSKLDLAIEAQVTYAYNPIGKRDPFRSFLATGERSGDDVPQTPLQRYEVDQYVLVGIVWGVDRPRALVQDPEGVGHVMEVGTYIGKSWGKVTEINDKAVIVTEEYQTIHGDLVVNEIPLSLPISDG
ncbi:MAG: pilus assembly protein PilP [Oligoflexia bacterium]|nr:pilus assembly protein PilP [Oligoflexia bacterium]